MTLKHTLKLRLITIYSTSKKFAVLFFNTILTLFLHRENMPSHFKIKEYCPLVFRNLRERFAIDDSDYRQSLTR